MQNFRKITENNRISYFILGYVLQLPKTLARLLYRKKIVSPLSYRLQLLSRSIEQKENVNIQSWRWHHMHIELLDHDAKSVRTFWRARCRFCSIPRLFSTCQRWRIPLAAILLITINANFSRPHSNIVTQGERLLQRQIRLILSRYIISVEEPGTNSTIRLQANIYSFNGKPSLLNAYNARNS